MAHSLSVRRWRGPGSGRRRRVLRLARGGPCAPAPPVRPLRRGRQGGRVRPLLVWALRSLR
eukprot:5877519-Alexandrium_andersonii.AAC.1